VFLGQETNLVCCLVIWLRAVLAVQILYGFTRDVPEPYQRYLVLLLELSNLVLSSRSSRSSSELTSLESTPNLKERQKRGTRSVGSLTSGKDLKTSCSFKSFLKATQKKEKLRAPRKSFCKVKTGKTSGRRGLLIF
jgi:hypothetical protein